MNSILSVLYVYVKLLGEIFQTYLSYQTLRQYVHVCNQEQNYDESQQATYKFV